MVATLYIVRDSVTENLHAFAANLQAVSATVARVESAVARDVRALLEGAEANFQKAPAANDSTAAVNDGAAAADDGAATANDRTAAANVAPAANDVPGWSGDAMTPRIEAREPDLSHAQGWRLPLGWISLVAAATALAGLGYAQVSVRERAEARIEGRQPRGLGKKALRRGRPAISRTDWSKSG